MPILIDLSQIAISNYMVSPNAHKAKEVDNLLIKHMILNSLRAYKQKFSREYGTLVICCDSKHYWRKDIFPHYKAHRKKNRSKSSIPWDDIFDCISAFKDDLREYFPYKVIEVNGAEADDIIAVIAKNETTATLIIGSDKDYCQLQVFGHIKQYSPKSKKFIEVDNAHEHLQELIIRGDKEDGIPNIKSDADTFVNDTKRASPMSTSKIEKWIKMLPKEYCESKTMLENYKRNQNLIDFNFIPDKIQQSILDEYKKPVIGDRTKVMDYFIKNRMRNLLSDIDQF